MVIKWDGVKRWNEDWNKDLTMEEAFKSFCCSILSGSSEKNWKDTMQQWLDSLRYGNKNWRSH